MVNVTKKVLSILANTSKKVVRMFFLISGLFLIFIKIKILLVVN